MGREVRASKRSGGHRPAEIDDRLYEELLKDSHNVDYEDKRTLHDYPKGVYDTLEVNKRFNPIDNVSVDSSVVIGPDGVPRLARGNVSAGLGFNGGRVGASYNLKGELVGSSELNLGNGLGVNGTVKYSEGSGHPVSKWLGSSYRGDGYSLGYNRYGDNLENAQYKAGLNLGDVEISALLDKLQGNRFGAEYHNDSGLHAGIEYAPDSRVPINGSVGYRW